MFGAGRVKTNPFRTYVDRVPLNPARSFAGYKGLYGGLNVTEIKQRKGIDKKDDLLDCVDHTELAANYFRITQAQQKIAQQEVKNEALATKTHHEVGAEVRRTMQRISGVTPENLPAAPNLKKLKSKSKPKGLLDGEA